MKLNKTWIILIVVIAVIGIVAGLFVGSYNGLVELEEQNQENVIDYIQKKVSKRI